MTDIIAEKIEAVRKKPEHVRLRYVWGSVIVVMAVVIALWVFSLKESLESALPISPEEDASRAEQADSVPDIRQPSLQERFGEEGIER